MTNDLSDKFELSLREFSTHMIFIIERLLGSQIIPFS